MTKTVCPAICILLLGQACAAEGPETLDRETRAAPLFRTTEQLLAVPPPGWKQIYQFNNIATRLTDFVPADESAGHWEARLSFESFRGLTDADPIEVLLSEAEKEKEKCSFVQHFNLFSGYENNYPTSIRLIMCGENKAVEEGEIKLIKAIKGDDYFYVVRVLKRLPAFDVNEPDFGKEKMADWATWFRQISLCNSARTDHPCPPTEQ